VRTYTATFSVTWAENKTTTETIPATNHANKYAGTAVDATCNDAGHTAGIYCPDCETWLEAQTEIPATGNHNYVNGKCENCDAEEPQPTVTIRHYGQNLYLQDLIKIGYFFYIQTDAEVEDVGALIWSTDDYAKETDFTVNSTNAAKHVNLKNQNGYYEAVTEGIYAQNLDAVYYMIPYVKTASGYTYGTAQAYCALNYIEGVYKITDPAWANTRSLVIDLANYATAARAYFCAKEGLPEPVDTFNSCLSEADRILKWSDSLYRSYPVVEEAGSYNDSFYGRNIYLLEAISISIYHTTTQTTGAHYWTAADYSKYSEHVAENKSGDTSFVREAGYVTISLTGLYAYNIYDEYYTRTYDAAGNLGKTTGHSVAAYLTQAIEAYKNSTSAEEQALVELCKAMLVYGNNAKDNPAISRG
jgi:hypothetical protein